MLATESGRIRDNEVHFTGIPELAVRGSCHFVETLEKGTWAPANVDCPMPFSEFLMGLVGNDGVPVNVPAVPSSRDGRFRLLHIDNLHRNWLDQYVTTDLKDNVVSAATGALIGTVKETTHDSVQSRFAEHEGQDYLLVIEGGTHLKVYKIAP